MYMIDYKNTYRRKLPIMQRVAALFSRLTGTAK